MIYILILVALVLIFAGRDFSYRGNGYRPSRSVKGDPPKTGTSRARDLSKSTNHINTKPPGRRPGDSVSPRPSGGMGDPPKGGSGLLPKPPGIDQILPWAGQVCDTQTQECRMMTEREKHFFLSGMKAADNWYHGNHSAPCTATESWTKCQDCDGKYKPHKHNEYEEHIVNTVGRGWKCVDCDAVSSCCCPSTEVFEDKIND
jgi:hypothetical protein